MAEAAPAKGKAPKAPKAPKELSPEKKLEQLIKRVFMTPFARRMRYLILIPTLQSNLFVLCSDKEDDQNYGSPSMSLGFVIIDNPEDLEMVANWLNGLSLSPNELALLDILSLSSACAKAKWKRESLVVERAGVEKELRVIVKKPDTDEVIDEITPLNPFTSLFPAIQLERLVNIYLKRINDVTSCYRYPYAVRDKENVFRIQIPRAKFANTELGQRFGSDINMLSIRGLDLIDARDFPEGSPDLKYCGYLFWSPENTRVALYMHTMETDRFTVMATRCNVFLTPTHDIV